jgi:hypothetical protein
MILKTYLMQSIEFPSTSQTEDWLWIWHNNSKVKRKLFHSWKESWLRVTSKTGL